jgi:adenine phosphoribosyltransferase
MDLKKFIRDVPGFPKEGIVFRDITPLLKDAAALQEAVRALAAPFREEDVELVLGAEARGFILGGAVACELGAGFVPVRKVGKLPAETIEQAYELEYGTSTLAMHRDAVRAGQRVLLVDDLLATGGTVAACAQMVEALGGEVVACAFLVELSFLKGRDALRPYRVVSLIEYEAE